MATGIDTITPSTAPATAICMVSTIFQPSRASTSGDRFGGKARLRKSAKRGGEDSTLSTENPAPARHQTISVSPST